MGHAAAHAGDSRGAPLRTALAVTAGICALELAGGIVSHSLALLADSAHVFMDAISLAIALLAAIGAQRPANDRQSYGYARFEVLAALANGGLLFAVAILIAYAAIDRFGSTGLPRVDVMSGVAAIGFLANAGIGFALVAASRHDLNVKAALFHVASDAVGALAVVLGGVAIYFTRATWIDPALSLVVAAIVAYGVVQIVREAADVLLQSAPPHAPIAPVRACMREVPGVVDVHDLHVWSIGTGSHVLSAHVLLPDARISEASAVLRELEERLHDRFDIHHVTIQFECESCAPDSRIICTQPRR